MVSMASLLYLFKDCPPELLANLDATQVSIDFDEYKELATTGRCRDDGIPLTRVGPSKMGVMVKQFTLISATGHISITLLMAEITLDEDDFVHFPVQGLSLGMGDPSFTTEVCFCKTRSGTKSFYEYLFSEVVVNFMNKLRDLTSSASRGLTSLVIVDGEAMQAGILQSQNVIDNLLNNNITIGKGPASTSGSCGNPVDMGDFFKSQKTLVKHSSDLDIKHQGLYERILDAIKTQCTLGKLSKMASERKKKAATALIRTVRACDRMNRLTDTIQNGFKLLGLYPYNAELTIRRCAIQVEEKDEKNILNAITNLAKLMDANGQVTEADMDNENIPTTKDPKTENSTKDQRPQERQRAIILTHAAAVGRRVNYIEKRDLERKTKEEGKLTREKEKETRMREREERKIKTLEEKFKKDQNKAQKQQQNEQKK